MIDRKLPSGAVTFLLSDVEGSTRLWETTPSGAAAALARHAAILASVVDGLGGVRPLEQGEGDSTVSAFSRPSDAVKGGVCRPGGHCWGAVGARGRRAGAHGDPYR